jgi:hypothetical protein
MSKNEIAEIVDQLCAIDTAVGPEQASIVWATLRPDGSLEMLEHTVCVIDERGRVRHHRVTEG